VLRGRDHEGVLVAGSGLSRRRRRQLDQAARLRARQASSRYRLAYDAAGPKVRLGLLWFLLALGALRVGPVALAVLYGIVAAVAALQAAWARRMRPPRPFRPVSALVALGLPVAALAGTQVLGLAVLVAVGLALLAGYTGPPRRGHPIDVAAASLACGLFPGLACASLVLVRDVDLAAAIVLLVFVSAYEVGDFLVGSGAGNVVEGPAAGMIGLLVVAFTVSLLRPSTFHDAAGVWALAGMTAVLCPLGQLVASTLLPSGTAFAPALRRLDSLLLVAPLWAVLLMGKVGLG
jgi:hypothetical protein